MLKSLYIKNYRCLESFAIHSLERVNLITGKNNTGKSSLLEALVLYASNGNIGEIKQLLESHGEYRHKNQRDEDEKDPLEVLSSLFYGRSIGFYNNNSIGIGEIGKQGELFDNENILINPNNSVEIRFVRYIEEIRQDASSELTSRRIISSKEEERGDVKSGLILVLNGKESTFLPITTDFFRQYPLFRGSISKKYQYVKTSNIDSDDNGALFDKIALSVKEQYVVEALQIIEPETERIAFVDSGTSIGKYRTPVIKLKNSREIVPLRSMGDGINRVLTIILALINCEDGYLMIDEVENGLHYSVQEELWKIIFELSDKLNVQVFATTHSEDSINSFERVLNKVSKNKSGKLIRLENRGGNIKEVQYTAEELRIANEHNIEIR